MTTGQNVSDPLGNLQACGGNLASGGTGCAVFLLHKPIRHQLDVWEGGGMGLILLLLSSNSSTSLRTLILYGDN